MIHTLKDGDILKILPFINEKNSNKIEWGRVYDMAFCDTGIVYDNKGYLKKMYWEYREKNKYKSNLPTLSRRYMFHCYINGENKLVSLGRRLFELIKDNDTLVDIRCNNHIYVKKDMKSQFASYDESCVISHNWNPPIVNVENGNEWVDWLKSNQPDIDSYMSNYTMSKNRKGLIDLFGGDLLGEIIKKERNEKLETILK